MRPLGNGLAILFSNETMEVLHNSSCQLDIAKPRPFRPHACMGNMVVSMLACRRQHGWGHDEVNIEAGNRYTTRDWLHMQGAAPAAYVCTIQQGHRTIEHAQSAMSVLLL